jgi:hypothetical protein
MQRLGKCSMSEFNLRVRYAATSAYNSTAKVGHLGVRTLRQAIPEPSLLNNPSWQLRRNHACSACFCAMQSLRFTHVRGRKHMCTSSRLNVGKMTVAERYTQPGRTLHLLSPE